MFDLIGDIHGQADHLTDLLSSLGYQRHGGVYRHPERRVIFLGDFIDRGPKIRETIAIAQTMVEAGEALAVIGNHELNIIAYHTEVTGRPGTFVREHSDKNHHQVRQTLEQLQPRELRDALEWFRTLPLWLDLDGLRVVHACWDAAAISEIAKARVSPLIDDEFVRSACHPAGELFRVVETVLKGKEAKLPDGIVLRDVDGSRRDTIRTRWYRPADGETYRTYALNSTAIDLDLPIPPDVVARAVPYCADAKPVFVGHYLLSAPKPYLLAPNVACLDFGVAKGGPLCAYRWNGEQTLTPDHFVWVDRSGG